MLPYKTLPSLFNDTPTPPIITHYTSAPILIRY